jgi:hypothetical protein
MIWIIIFLIVIAVYCVYKGITTENIVIEGEKLFHYIIIRKDGRIIRSYELDKRLSTNINNIYMVQKKFCNDGYTFIVFPEKDIEHIENMLPELIHDPLPPHPSWPTPEESEREREWVSKQFDRNNNKGTLV